MIMYGTKLSIMMTAIAWMTLAQPVNAQDYAVDWHSIDGGGGTVSGGTYMVRGAIGQPDAAEVAGGTFEVKGGFIQAPPTQTINCFAASQPVVHQVQTTAGDLVEARNNRFLSVEAGDVGQTQAIRVTFVDLPAPFDAWNGAQMFVDEPFQLSEKGGTGLANAPAPGDDTLTVAGLRCDALLRDWDGGPVHIYHEGIIPGGIYSVQSIDSSCELGSESSFSAAAVITNALWSDVVGPFNAGGNYWGANDGSVDVATDVVAMLDKFGSQPGSPRKFAMDLEPGIIDGKINITDVTMILDAFGGAAYPFAPGGPAPCP